MSGTGNDEILALRQENLTLRRQLATLEQRLAKVEAGSNGKGTDRSATSKYDRPELQPPMDVPDLSHPTPRDLEEWVVKTFGTWLERRPSNTRRWCRRWYEHPEVVVRMWALYDSWHEATRHDSAMGQSSWFVDHLDKHLDVIFSPDGPFAGCTPDRHNPSRSLDVGTSDMGYYKKDDLLYAKRKAWIARMTGTQQPAHEPVEVT
jgi:hypothetical protein